MALYIRRLSSLPMMDFEADLGCFLLIYSKDMRCSPWGTVLD